MIEKDGNEAFSANVRKIQINSVYIEGYRTRPAEYCE